MSCKVHKNHITHTNKQRNKHRSSQHHAFWLSHSHLFFPFIITSPTSSPPSLFFMSPFTIIPVSFQSKSKIKILDQRKRDYLCMIAFYGCSKLYIQDPTQKKWGPYYKGKTKYNKENFNGSDCTSTVHNMNGFIAPYLNIIKPL